MKIISSIIGLAFLGIMLTACSSDDKDTPTHDLQEYPTQEEYKDKITNRLWVVEEAKWIDDEGNIYPEMVGMIGFADPYAYYFLTDGYICFPGEYPFSMLFDKLKYNEGRYYDESIENNSGPQILRFSGNEIILKDYVNHYRESADSPKREDVWRYQRYVLEENPDWETIYKEYIPDNYNPQDYGMK